MKKNPCITFSFIHYDISRDIHKDRKKIYTAISDTIDTYPLIIITSELSLSGYSFKNRNEALEFSLQANSPEIEQYALLADRKSAYIGIGFIEYCAATGLLYNSYRVYGPNGDIACHYRKIQAEESFGTPGDPGQQETFETPWGTVGLLICSDSYQALLARKAVLEGARLLLIPANWPSGTPSPQLIWQARARENGVPIAVCNRTGKLPTIDFRSGKSFLFGPDGGILMEGASETSRVFTATLPLDAHGKLPDAFRAERLAGRTPGLYYPMTYDRRYYNGLETYCSVRITALPSAFSGGDAAIAGMEVRTGKSSPEDKTLLTVLPPLAEKDSADWLNIHGGEPGHAIFSLIGENGRISAMLFKEDGGAHRAVSLERTADADITVINAGPLRICPARLEEALQPEFGHAASKLGADVLAISECRCPVEELPVLQCRTTAQLAVAMAADTALVCLPPKGHRDWTRVVSGTAPCMAEVELESMIRRKFFQDRMDFRVFWAGSHD